MRDERERDRQTKTEKDKIRNIIRNIGERGWRIERDL